MTKKGEAGEIKLPKELSKILAQAAKNTMSVNNNSRIKDLEAELEMTKRRLKDTVSDLKKAVMYWDNAEEYHSVLGDLIADVRNGLNALVEYDKAFNKLVHKKREKKEKKDPYP